jgi:Zn-dependent peptidase ImmA (M78 family)
MRRADGKGTMELVKEYSMRPPVDVPALIMDLGIRYIETSMRDDVSGYIKRLDHGFYEIAVNKFHAPVRRRFTAAHELGHYLFHRDLLEGEHEDCLWRKDDQEFAKRKKSGILLKHETEANRFAANLLMNKTVLDLVIATQTSDTGELADKFQVSRRAMEIRLGRNRVPNFDEMEGPEE